MGDEELVVEFTLMRLDHPEAELEDVAALVVRRLGPERVLDLAARNLAERGALVGSAFESAVECVLRIVLRMRGAGD